MIQLGIMVNELLTNSIKYAFKEEGGVITIELYHHDGHCKFVYSDNGTGVMEPDKLANGRSLGIKLIHLTAKQLGGSIKISSPKGLKYEIEFNYE
jgi:two-component sensor histidine kinase